MPKEHYQPSAEEMQAAEEAMYPKQKVASEVRQEAVESDKVNLKQHLAENTYFKAEGDGTQDGRRYIGKIKGYNVVLYLEESIDKNTIDGLPITVEQAQALLNKYRYVRIAMREMDASKERARTEAAEVFEQERKRQQALQEEKIKQDNARKVEGILKELL